MRSSTCGWTDTRSAAATQLNHMHSIDALGTTTFGGTDVGSGEIRIAVLESTALGCAHALSWSSSSWRLPLARRTTLCVTDTWSK